MPEPKAQLVDPQGPIDVPGISATGIITATGGFVGAVQGAATGLAATTYNISAGVVTSTGFVGDVTGTASSVTKGTNLSLGIVTASSFAGDVFGNAAGLSTTTAGLKLGIVSATSFAGNFTGIGSGITGTPNIQAGIMTATSFAGNFTGLASGITGTPNLMVGILTGTAYSGDGSNLTGIAATNWITNNIPGSIFSINVTASGSSNYTLSGTDRSGSVSGSDPTVTVEIGDTLNFVVDASGHPFYIRVSDGGANVSTPAATNQGSQSGTVSWIPNTAGTYYYQCGNHAGMIGTITVTATTTIDLSLGNVVKYAQSVDTTVSFANTGTSNIVTFVRTKDDTSTERTITWPSSIKWDGGAAPTLNTASTTNDANVITLLTRDEGVTWYGWETISSAGGYYMFMWGDNEQGRYGNNTAGPTTQKSSPTQMNGGAEWNKLYGSVSDLAPGAAMAAKQLGTLWMWGDNQHGMLGQNQAPGVLSRNSSPVQVPGTNWAQVDTSGYGYNSAAAVKTDGTFWTWGNNEAGRLGQNQKVPNGLIATSSPTQVPGTTWRATDFSMGCSEKITMAIKTDGTLWGWGAPYATGYAFPGGYRSSPVQIGSDTTWSKLSVGQGNNYLATKTDGTMWAGGYSLIGHLGLNADSSIVSPAQIGSGTDWGRHLYMGYGAGAAIKTDGTLWVWGDNRYGNLAQGYINNPGGGTTFSSPIQIPGTNWLKTAHYSYFSTHALKTDGTLWTWGIDARGSLGLGEEGWGDADKSSPVQVGSDTDWVDIASAYYGVTALKSGL